MSQQDQKQKTYAKLKIYYKYRDDSVRLAVVNFEKESCFSGGSYKDNLDEAIFEIIESSGVWISKEVFIPYHRIIFIQTVLEENKEENKEPAKSEQQEKPKEPKEQKKTHKANRRVKRRRVQTKENTVNGTKTEQKRRTE